jgi:60s Acidic ribosomal protein
MDLSLRKGTQETLRFALGSPQNMSLWYTSQALEGKDVKDLLLNVGSGGGAAAAPSAGGAAGGPAPEEAAKEEEKEEGTSVTARIPWAKLECPTN